MGWNTTAVFAAGKTRAEMAAIVPDVFVPSGKTLGWETASTTALGKNVAVGEIPGWGVIWSPNINVTSAEEVLEPASLGGRAVAIYLSSVSGIHGFALWVDGAFVRLLMREGSEVAVDDGDPIPEEAGVDWADAEAAVLGIAGKLTGIAITNAETWANTTFEVLEI